MKLVNLTPHDINIVDSEGNILKTIPSEQNQTPIPRVQATAEIVGEINGIDIVKTQFGEVTNLPDPKPDTIYIVSSLVAQAAKDRDDIVAPDTSPQSVFRNSSGQIVGVRRFQRF